MKAYGEARLDPPMDARPQMRYSIGSVSKQFLARAILLLVQDGKISLDDHVSKYLPNLTHAREMTIRELLSHTAEVEGKIDRALLSSDAGAYFTRQVLADASASLKELGPPTSLKQTSVELRGGMTYRHFHSRASRCT